jgi:hypothetical protein
MSLSSFARPALCATLWGCETVQVQGKKQDQTVVAITKSTDKTYPSLERLRKDMDGTERNDYEKVINRLNHPDLTSLYVRTNFTFQIDKLRKSLNAKQTFENKGGVCRHYATFVTEALSIAGYDVKNFTVIWGNDQGHTVSVLKGENKEYRVVMDSNNPGIITGPYKSYDEISKIIAKGKTIKNTYVENNSQLYNRNLRAYGQ